MAVTAIRKSPRFAHRGGLTLVEAMFSIVIVGTVIVMALHTFGSVARGRQIVAVRHIGSALGRQLMSEVLQNRYEEPDDTPAFGPEGAESLASRADYDDVDDYHGWSASPPETKEGSAIPDLDGWRRSVSVQYVDPDAVDTVVGSDRGLKRITVTVTDPKGVEITHASLRGSSSAYDREAAAPTPYVAWVGVELQVGSEGSARIVSGTNPLNQVP